MKNKIILKKLVKKNISTKYEDWLNDKSINRYTEQRFVKHTKKSIWKFVNAKNICKNEFLFGIFIIYQKKKIHVGNIKLGPIDFNHKRADISYFIGDKNFHQKGIMYFAIKKIIKKAQQKKIKKLNAGCYSNNIASIKLLKKLKFKKEAIFYSHVVYQGKRIKSYSFGKVI